MLSSSPNLVAFLNNKNKAIFLIEGWQVKSSQVNLYLNTVKSIRNLKIKNNLTILNKIQNLTTTNLTKTCFSWMPCITLKMNIN